MAADRRVDAAGDVEPVRAEHLVVERFAHAVQALELVVRDAGVACHLAHRCQRQRVVGGELRVGHVGGGQQPARAGLIADVAVDLAREHRIAGLALHLGALDLAVPVGPLDQANGQPPPAAPREIDQPVDDPRRALLVGLHDHAEAVPVRQCRIGGEAPGDVERQIEPLALLGVDGEPHAVPAGQHAQFAHARQQFGQYPLALGAAIARVQRRQLHRDAGPGFRSERTGDGADLGDRCLVGGEVGIGLGGGDGGFAEHVEREAIAALPSLAGVGQCLADGLPGDELLAEQAHRQVDTLADHRLAAARDQLREAVAELLVAVGRYQAARDHQPPGCRVDEQRLVAAEMGAPVAAADLVADQGVGRGRIGNPQQCFGQAHERHALAAGQRELAHQGIDAARAAASPAKAGDQPAGDLARRLQPG